MEPIHATLVFKNQIEKYSIHMNRNKSEFKKSKLSDIELE